MTNLKEARNVTEEIVRLLQGMSSEQKLRAKDVLTGIMLVNMSVNDLSTGDDKPRKAG